MDMRKIDYLLIGQGTAGSLLAWQLMQKGCRVLVVDDGRPSSSRVAAGICNPVTGRKLTRTWLADELFPYLHDFYRNLERELDTSFFHPVPLYRPYQSIEEQNFFIAQTANPLLQDYVRLSASDQAYASLIHNDLGGLETLQAAWVDLPVMLDALRDRFREAGALAEDSFSWDDVIREEDSVTWKDIQARKIISCEGAYARFGPYFGWLPWAVVKGEILSVDWPGQSLPGIVNQSIWIQPHKDGTFRVGSTYEWDDLDWEPTEKGRTYLEGKLTKLTKLPFEIQRHVAGIRPATQGRRPFAGLHPEYTPIGIFNGLGSKGTSLAPFLSRQLADFLTEGKELHPDANIERFHSLYFSSLKS